MDILDRITLLLAGKDQKELTAYLNLNSVAFSEWKSGKSKSYRKYLIEIAEFFNVSIDYLVYGTEKSPSLPDDKDEQELLNYYKKLPEREQQRLIGRAAGMVDVCCERVNEKSKKTDTVPTIEVKHSYYKVSAGTGCYLDDSDSWDTISVPATSEARRSDFCLTISGDSMEPIYYDGDIVLVKSQPSVELGQIGIFTIEGSGYIKKYGGDRLISLNDKYSDILFSEYDPNDIYCNGLVIGRV